MSNIGEVVKNAEEVLGKLELDAKGNDAVGEAFVGGIAKAADERGFTADAKEKFISAVLTAVSEQIAKPENN